MIVRGNGVRASKSVSVRMGREALLRKALLGSTALVGVAIASPALAQTSVAGGHVTSTASSSSLGGGANQGTEAIFSGGGSVVVDGATINNTTGAPNANALDLENSGGTGFGVNYANNASTLTTTQNGGAAAYISQTGANLGIDHAVSGNVFTGSYGERYIATGSIFYMRSGTGGSDTYIANGGAVAGVHLTGSSVGADFDSPTISGFTTGIYLNSTMGSSMTSLGGTISATGTGISASASAGGVNINSQTAITAGNGISVSGASDLTVTTSGTGTLDARTAGSGYGIGASTSGPGLVNVNVGAAIGGTTAFDRGVSFTSSNPSTATFNITTTAAITAANYGIYAQVWGPAAKGTIDIGANITASTAIYNSGGSYDYIIRSGAIVTSTGAGNSALSSGNSTSTLNNAGTLRALGTGAAGFQLYGLQSLTNSGTISGTAQGVWMLNSSTINNTGTIQGGTSAGIYGSVGTVNNTGAGALISGDTGITTTGNPLNLTNSGTVSGTTWGVVVGGSTTTINSTGTISGGTGSIQLNSTFAQTVNLNAGSTTTGNITAGNTGARTITLTGLLTGGYDATGGANTAVDTFTLAAAGHITGAIALGDGNDKFIYQGGTLDSTVDGGDGTDNVTVTVATGTSRTLNQSNLLNFETFTHTSGNLTLTGSRDGGAGWVMAGGSGNALTLSGSLTNIAGNAISLTAQGIVIVQAGSQLSATGDVIYTAATGNNISNSGTITSGAALASAIAIGSGTVTNSGTITYSGGANTTQGNGILGSTNQLTVTNNAGASIVGRWDGVRANNGIYSDNYGLIRGDRFAGIEINGGAVINNYGTGRIYGATSEGSGILISSGTAAVNVTNSLGGVIVGAGNAGIFNNGTGMLNVSNAGRIGAGTLDGSNNFVGGTGANGIYSASLAVYNSGTISGVTPAVQSTSSMVLNNIGTIVTTGNGRGAVEVSSGSATIRNAGSISAPNYSGVMMMSGGTLTNAVGGTITGGNDATFGAAVFSQGFGTINNYGTLTSTNGAGIVVAGNNSTTINLFAGSNTGSITGGNGNETLAIYNGQLGASGVATAITDPVSGGTSTMTLQNAGTLGAAVVGAINLGSGSDTIQLRGTGTGAQSSSLGLASVTGVETINKVDSGEWTITGAATSATNVNVNGGILTVQGSSGLGSIYVNGGTLRAFGSGALGTATVHMITSNVQFGAAGSYGNNFVLDVAAAQNGTPVVFDNLFGGLATLAGSITTGTGNNAAGEAINATQNLTFAGLAGSTFNLTSTANSWTGVTTINSGVTLQGTTSTISGGSIVNNGTLTYSQSVDGTISKAISGTGALVLGGGNATYTLTANNNFTGGTTINGSNNTLLLGSTATLLGTVAITDASSALTFNRTDGGNISVSASGAGMVNALGSETLNGNFTNAGAFTVNPGVSGTVILNGSRSGANGSGIYFNGNSNTFRVGFGGSVVGGEFLGIRVNGTNSTVDNLGAVTNTGTGGDAGWGAAIGVAATSGTTIINNGSSGNSTATISGQNGGINHLGSGGVVATGLLTVNNYGLIAGNLYNAIENQGGSGALTVTNYGTGRIVGQGNAGGGNGIAMGGSAALTLTNAGLIVGRTNGIATGGSVNITNQNGGIIAAGTLSSGTSGTLTAGGGNGIQAVGGTITNQAGGVIRGSFLNGSGSDTNAITSTAATTIINSGQILGVAIGSTSTARTNGVYVSGGLGTVTNNATGLITGGWDGVYITAGGTVTNSGTIAGYLYNGVENATRINNNAGGRILGLTAGASMLADAIVDNSGTIASASYNSSTNTFTATNGTGLLVSSASVANQFGATISGATGISATGALSLGNSGLISGSTNAGVRMSGANSAIYNNATITGGNDATQGFGVIFANTATGSLTNRVGSLVSGGTGGFFAGGTSTYIDNSGSIVGLNAGSIGAYFQSTGNIATNQTNGLIVGQDAGVAFANAGNVNNSGFIGSGTLSGGTSGTFTVNANGIAVSMNGGYATNYEGATITGGLYGIHSGGITAANIANYGTINATTAIHLIGNNDDTVTLGANSVTNGAIVLDAGNDTLNWYGGSFTSIDGGAGNDSFNATIYAPATLNLANLSGFEAHTLSGGQTLTLTGTQAAGDGGWSVNASALVLDATANIQVSGSPGITLSNGADLTISQGGKLVVTGDNGVLAYSGTDVTNAGLIRASSAGTAGVITNGGGAMENQATGRIIAGGTGFVLQAANSTLNNAGIIIGAENGVTGSDAPQTLVNTGIISVGSANDNVSQYWQINQNYTSGDGVHFTAGGSVTNTGGANNGGTITGGANGVSISGGAATIENSGAMIGFSGYGLSLDTAAGVTSTITNHLGGSMEGGSGAMLLSGDGTVNMTNEVGSYMYGSIVSTGNGTRNIDLSGVVYGDYDASSGAGVDHVIFRSGVIDNVYLGDGDDQFTYLGGTINGIVDGGAGTNALFGDFSSSGSVTLASFANFQSISLIGGNVTVDGSNTTPGMNIYSGNGTPSGTLTFVNSQALTNDIFVNGGDIRTNEAGGFGSGTIHMVDPTAIFGATGTYANNISLEVVTPSSANPATLKADAGVTATLTGAITTSGQAGVDPNQDLVFGGQGTIVLTNTANNWTGSTTINLGATLQGATDTISGTSIVNNGWLTYQQAYSGTVSQDITGNGYVEVRGVAAGNAVTFTGTNTIGGALLVSDASNIVIDGATSALLVDLGLDASRLDVTAQGSISTTSSSAVGGYGAGQSVYNLGAITSTGNSGVYLMGAGSLLDNSGTITGNRGFWGDATDITLINRAGGTITGNTYNAVYFNHGGTIENSGTIQALNANPAIYASGGAATITNNAGGSITSDGTVIALYGAGSSLTNTGSITSSSDTAVYLASGGTVTNAGSITANGNGVGVWTSAGGTFTNQSGGTITGGYAGMFLDGADLITVNLETGSTTDRVFSFGSGARVITIAGTLNGGYAGGQGTDDITLDTSATVTGVLDGGAGTNSLALVGTGSATLGDVANIASATKSGTGTWTLGSATDIAAWTVTGGTLVTNGGAIADTASVAVNGGTLQLGGNEAIGILTGSGTAALGTNLLALTSGTGSFDGTLTGTTGGLLIDGANLSFGGTVSYAGLTEVHAGSLTLTPGATFNGASSLLVGTAGTLDLGTTSIGVAAARLDGTLNGTGTLAATNIELNGATVNGNLAGTQLTQASGTSTLAGTATMNVLVSGGTLLLAADDRIADTATVQLNSGTTLDLGTHSDTVGTLVLNGTLAGTGTLTASQYQLSDATVNANLGAGTLFNLAGTSTLNGTAAGNAAVQAGTLMLGGDNRLADSAIVTVSSGATLDIGAHSDTIGTLGLAGTLAGTGTLTASEYQLSGAIVNANLGTGTVYNLGGTSTLNGTAGGNVAVQGGALALGASNRLADTATVAVSTGATLDLGSYNDTIGTLAVAGTLAGTGTLTAGQYQLTGATVNANLGAGALFNLGGTSVLNGSSAGNVSVQAGTLTLGAANRLGDAATVAVASGATLNLNGFNDTVSALGLNGTLAGTGTLTAGEYQLTGATVNANLGAGNLFQLGGSSVLNGTSASTAVQIQGGTLLLGAANRLADTATVLVSTGATLNLGANNDTVAALGLSGTLAGSGTLTAAQYQLTGATVNANLGTGALYNMGGTSVLSGTSAAGTVTVQGGTLRLGASDRLADTAVVGVAAGTTFDLATYNETLAGITGTGTIALGTGRLTLSSASSSVFGGAITGSGSIDKQGIGTLTLAGTFATTGRFDVSAGTLAFSGSTQGGIRVQGGTLIGGGTLAGALTLNSGTFSPGGLATGALGAINPIGSFTVNSLVATGGTLLFDFGGMSFNFASDSIKVNGTATLSGGTVQVNALTAAASDYRFNQLYTIVQANALTGTFANGSTFATVTSNPNLKWRLRYDLVANAVVLQVQKNMEFNDGVAAGDTNTLAVANALSNSTTGNASDQWASTLNTITALGTADRVAAFKTFSGEALANVSTATISANNLFTDLLRQRVGDGSDALIGGGFTGTSLADVRTTTTSGSTFTSALSGASLPGADNAEAGKGGIWGQVYGGYQKLLGDGVRSGVDTTTAGVAMGLEARLDGFTAGIAGGIAQVDSDMDARYSTVSGNQYQLGGYLSYDAGVAFVAASGSWYSSDLNSKRTLMVGSTTALATGDIHTTGYAVGLTGGFRTELGNGLRLALIGNASKVRNQQDGFTENATGGLGLQMASANRDLFTAGAELRLGAKVKTGAGTAMPWVSMGVRYNSGDLDTVGSFRFSGAPSGTGGFGIQGVKIAPVLGTLGVGIDARASKNVRLGVALEGSAGENTREGRASVRVKIGF